MPNTPSTNCIVKVQDAVDGLPYDFSNKPFTIGLFGFMPAVPKVGEKAALTLPESDEHYCEIVETSVTVPKLSTGLGPFEDCIKVKCWPEGSSCVEVEYYCPNFGGVRSTEKNHESKMGMDLKEVMSVGCPGDFDGYGDVDGSNLAVFAADFGRTDCP